MTVWDDTKYAEDGKIIKVDHERWIAAQQYEEKTWIENFHLGDDWNNWWKEKFDSYSIIEKHFGDGELDALEVGCGPFTNVRLIEECVYNIKSITCSDPLIETYKKLPCWIRNNVNRIKTNSDQLENLVFNDESFDLVVCINVLDHVEDVEKCFTEMKRVLKPNGLLILGQDLTDWEKRKDPNPEQDQDQGHPIRVNEEYCREKLTDLKELKFDVVESRNKDAHYGCLCYIGKKE